MNVSRKKPDTRTVLPVPLDEETEAKLRRLSVICGDEPVVLAANLLRDILSDDELSHATLH